MRIRVNSESKIGLPSLWELQQYRFLVYLFVKKDFISKYKQNLLGPAWFVLQPLIMTLVFTIVFGGIAQIPTSGVPGPLFYICSLSAWNFFAQNFSNNSNLFLVNAPLYTKVYFPRLTIPIANSISSLMSFLVQFLLFWLVWIYYKVNLGEDLGGGVGASIIYLPLLLGVLMMLSLGIGLIFSSITSKYRDLGQLSAFLIQLWMYLSPVIYPMETITEGYMSLLRYNPVSPILEGYRYSLLGVGAIDWVAIFYSFLFSSALLVIGAFTFEKTQKRFADSI